MHPKTIFRLALSSKSVQFFLRFRTGSLTLPCVTGRAANIPGAHTFCTLCQTGNLGDEQHAVFECPALQGIKDRYNNLFGHHAATMVQFRWQHDTRAVAQFTKECADAHCDPALQSQASNQL